MTTKDTAMATTALPRRAPRKHRAPELLCDYCVWPAAYISPETGALVCDPYAHSILSPERCGPLVVARDEHAASTGLDIFGGGS